MVLVLFTFAPLLLGHADLEHDNNPEILGLPRAPRVVRKVVELSKDEGQASVQNNGLSGLGLGLADSGEQTVHRPNGSMLQFPRVPVSTVAILTFLMAIATGLGGIPFFFFKLESSWQSICNGMACGVMLAASFDLIQEGQEHGGGHCVVIGIVLGGLFIIVSQKALERFGDVKMMDLNGANARRMVLIVAIMTLHSFGEGSGVGVSFAGPKGFQQGLLVTIAIAVHNIPEGMAVSMVMASRGVKPRDALLWSIFTSLPQPIVAVPAFLCAETFSQFLPLCVGFAAGCMIWIVFGEVMPESMEQEGAKASHVASAATVSVAFMELVGWLLEGLEAPPRWDTLAPFGWSLLFILGPILGALLLISSSSSLHLPTSLLAGLSAGVTLCLAAYRPLQLLTSHKMNPLTLIFTLYVGYFAYTSLARFLTAQKSQSKGMSASDGEIMRSEKMSMSWLTELIPTHTGRIAVLSCMALAAHGFVEGLMVGVAAPNADAFGMRLLLPVSLHGLPRGIAVASALLGLGRTSGLALLGAAGTGMASPAGAMLAMATGLGTSSLDFWLVIACGCLMAVAVKDIMPRAVGLDRRKAIVGVVMGLVFVGAGLSSTHLLCLKTSLCNAAPEAVT